MTEKIEFLGRALPELEVLIQQLGQPAFRARQIYKWIYQKDTASFYEMSDLPKPLREQLNQQAQVSIPRVMKQKVSADGARKFLFELQDKKKIETVLIPQSNLRKSKHTLCISSQVGCPVRCSFCATGQSGFFRNLDAHEIVGQVLGSRREVNRRLKVGPDERLISNVVFMGMGEPLLNYEPVIQSIRLLNDHKGLDIGQRHITLSTAGDVGGIERLSREDLQITLAISLHAAYDRLRDQLIPLNRKYPLAQLLAAAEQYLSRTGRQVTFEYLMLDGVNIAQADAESLVTLLKPLSANINLIPYNTVTETPFRKPGWDKVLWFYHYLQKKGMQVTLREERGADIDAACGQLAVRGI
jgi:23S rRNA (adenine2503-C2)-methyltransferase